MQPDKPNPKKRRHHQDEDSDDDETADYRRDDGREKARRSEQSTEQREKILEMIENGPEVYIWKKNHIYFFFVGVDE